MSRHLARALVCAAAVALVLATAAAADSEASARPVIDAVAGATCPLVCSRCPATWACPTPFQASWPTALRLQMPACPAALRRCVETSVCAVAHEVET